LVTDQIDFAPKKLVHAADFKNPIEQKPQELNARIDYDGGIHRCHRRQNRKTAR
jgi:hypothetical protein